MDITKAEQIVERASNTEKALAVFLIDGKTKTTATTTDLFAQAMKTRVNQLVGIYNGDADPRWIVDDVAWMRDRIPA